MQEYILLGEKYESGALTHFENAMPADHTGQTGHENHGTAEAGHPQGHGSEDPGTLTRNGLTVVFASLVYVSYALILVAGFGLADSFGITVTAREGLLWGIAGFVSFQLAPSLGLAPELPGTIAADLTARQIWWWATVLATGTGLALLAYGRGYLAWVVAVGVLAAPHVIGAPLPDSYWGVAPPEVAAMFSARVLGVALAVWAVMGWLAGHFWTQEETA